MSCVVKLLNLEQFGKQVINLSLNYSEKKTAFDKDKFVFSHSHHYYPPDSVVSDSYRKRHVCGRVVVDRRQTLGAII